MAEPAHPLQIPPRAWAGAIVRVKDEVSLDHLPIVAAGMAFWAMFAIFPGLIALVSLWGLVADPAAVEEQVQALSSLLPPEASQIVATQMQEIAHASTASLRFGVVASLLAALWTASSGVGTATQAINMAYDRRESRGFVRLRALSLLLTLGAILVVMVVLSLAAVVPWLFGLVGLGGTARVVVEWARWPTMALLVVGALSVLYRHAPSRHKPPWRWVVVGAVVATLLWLAITVLFSVYVTRFGSYNEVYGALGGVIVLLLWFFLSSFAVLLGAELNAELERHAGRLPRRPLERETTARQLEPAGRRSEA